MRGFAIVKIYVVIKNNKYRHMKQTSKKRIMLIILIFGLFSLQAQETVSTTGGEATGTGSASYTIGQMVYTSHSGTNGNSTTQGVQQPFEISVVTGIHEAKGINLSASVYPNPTRDFLTLAISGDIVQTQFIASLYDTNGKLLKRKNITADKTKIATNDLTPAIYFLEVTDNEKVVKSFKIIKN